MCVLIGVNQLGFGGIVPALALYARSFGVSQSAIGVAVAVYGLARFVAAVPVGHFADRFGRRTTLALGGLVSAAGNLLCAYAPNYPTFVAARFVAGAGAALVLTCGLIVIADITDAAHRGRTMGIYQGTFLFAVGVGPLPGGLLAERFGLAAPFLVYAVAGAIVALVAWIQIPDTRGFRGDARAAADAPRLAFGAQVQMLVRQAGFVLVSLIGFTNALARTGGLFTVIPILGRDRLRVGAARHGVGLGLAAGAGLGLGADRIGFGLALASVVGLALASPAGVLVDRYGRKPVIVPSTVVCGIALLLFVWAPSYPWFLVACVAWSVAAGVSGAAPAAYAADVAPPGMNAAAISTYRMLSDFGYVVGPIALGMATDGFGANAALAVAAVLLVVVGFMFARWAPETYRSAGL